MQSVLEREDRRPGSGPFVELTLGDEDVAQEGAGELRRTVDRDLDAHFTIDHFVSSAEVIGNEVYPGGVGAPIRHRGPDAFCGVIMIWTR